MTQKQPNDWSSNPSAETNLRTYDSATTPYDSATLTYDGVVATDLNDTEKQANSWSPL